jgi:hypothetical protein
MTGHLLKEADLDQQAKEKIAGANIMNPLTFYTYSMLMPRSTFVIVGNSDILQTFCSFAYTFVVHTVEGFCSVILLIVYKHSYFCK